MANQISDGPEIDALLDLGVVLGQNQTLGLIAGRCSAAQAETLYRLRKDRLYKRVSEHWRDFCPRYLNVSGAQADRVIHLFEEFGSGYFEMAQLTRISEESYREIEPAISNGVLNLNGEQIELTLENSRKVAAAIAHSRRARKAVTPTVENHVLRLTHHYNTLSAEYHGIGREVSSEFDGFGAALRVLDLELGKLRTQYGYR